MVIPRRRANVVGVAAISFGEEAFVVGAETVVLSVAAISSCLVLADYQLPGSVGTQRISTEHRLVNRACLDVRIFLAQYERREPRDEYANIPFCACWHSPAVVSCGNGVPPRSPVGNRIVVGMVEQTIGLNARCI